MLREGLGQPELKTSKRDSGKSGKSVSGSPGTKGDQGAARKPGQHGKTGVRYVRWEKPSVLVALRLSTKVTLNNTVSRIARQCEKLKEHTTQMYNEEEQKS